MKRLLWFTLIVFSLSAQAQLSEDFSDGDFTTNPMWNGDVSKFAIENGKLRSNSAVANDIFYLSTPNSTAINCEWRFLINMQFATSSANYVDVVLVSDNANPSLAQNGYFLRIGNTKDEIALYKISNGSPLLLGDGTDGKTENKTINVRVIRSDVGQWQVFADYAGEINFTEEINLVDAQISSSTHFALVIKQSTASFFNKHFFDDFYIGSIVKDTTSPKITQLKVLSKNEVQLQFSEEIFKPFLSNFFIDKGIGLTTNLDSINPQTYVLQFGNDFGTEKYKLGVSNIMDLAGNILDTIIDFENIASQTALKGDILITEIYADPTPSFGLPEQEFVEIYNNTTNWINLENYTFSDGGTPILLPNFAFAPKSYVVLSKSNETVFHNANGELVLTPNLPALNNTGDPLVLKNNIGETLDAVSYTDDWYKDDIKAQGGFSLERIDFVTSCADESNWMASQSANGGTPGKQNSVFNQNPDKQAPQILSYTIENIRITLNLSEPLIESLTTDLSNFRIKSNNENPILLSVLDNGKTLVLTFATSFNQNQSYTLIIRELTDCAGNTSTNEEVEIFYFNDNISNNDLIINELLFNPKGDGVDFIELYNNSDKYINLLGFKLGRQVNDTTKDFKSINTFYVLQPQAYVAISIDSAKLQRDYTGARNHLQISSLPAMNNDAGIVLLANASDDIIDSVNYNESQHFELLSSTDGVSLERLSFTESGANASNWHSGAASSEFATPGYQNSQFLANAYKEGQFTLSYKDVSPDSDGYHDQLVLNYKLDGNGYVLNTYVYSLGGNLICQPLNNITLGSIGFATWNGVDDEGNKLPVGNYILLAQAFNLEGKVIEKKLAFSIVGTF
ncbi:MAG: hypothetical protein RLZZ337_197 [Bacteroidota bacterium]|jgi:hypothetical protein